jgi:hypothetical protein
MSTPAPAIGDWLVDAGWTLADLEAWYLALVLAFLEAGGWHTVPAGVVLEQWEMVLPDSPHDAQEAA